MVVRLQRRKDFITSIYKLIWGFSGIPKSIARTFQYQYMKIEKASLEMYFFYVECRVIGHSKSMEWNCGILTCKHTVATPWEISIVYFLMSCITS